MKERYWKYSLIVFILGLGYLLFRQAQPFMNGILGGFTLYLLLRNFTFWLQTKMKPALAVWLVTIGVTLFILIPLSLFSWALVSQVSKMHFDTEAIIRPAWHVIDFIKDRTGFDILSEKSLSFFVSQASSIGQSVMSGVSDLLVNLCVAIMLLFFMLYEGKSMEHYISTLLPFKAENKIEEGTADGAFQRHWNSFAGHYPRIYIVRRLFDLRCPQSISKCHVDSFCFGNSFGRYCFGMGTDYYLLPDCRKLGKCSDDAGIWSYHRITVR